MRFRTRLIVAMSVALAATLSISFTAVSVAVERSDARQLDEALRAEAREEAMEVASTTPHQLHLTNDDVQNITAFAALYDHGRVIDRSASLRRDPKDVDPTARPAGVPFDLELEGQRVRAIFAHVPESELVLLLAASRAELERDVRFLREVMFVAALASIIWVVVVSYSIARGLTRDHEAIAATAHRVTRGELDARVALRTGDDETVQLSHDIDRMIDRLEALVGSQQRFVAHAAHELRSPLSTLYGELQLALRRERSAEQYRKAIEDAMWSARRLIALTEDLLTLARTGADEAPTREVVDVRKVVDRAIDWARGAAEARSVRFVVNGDAIHVEGRRIDLERMVRNLLDNAVRHSPDGGVVDVGIERRGDRVEISVRDSGKGVDAADRERIFEPFYRGAAARADATGSGLGLPIAREIARAHGGDVLLAPADAASEHEKGGVKHGARFIASVAG